jgi:hypothetical protein
LFGNVLAGRLNTGACVHHIHCFGSLVGVELSARDGKAVGIIS